MILASQRSLRTAARSDAGFTLVEVMVACVVLMILAGAVFGVLATTLKTTRDDKNRVAAASLAERELEIVRQQFYTVGADGTYTNIPTIIGESHVVNPDQFPGGVANGPLVVGTTPYQVVLSVKPQLKGAGASACDGGSVVAHPAYEAQVTVSWANQGLTRDVTSSTILTPPKNVVDDSLHGFYAVKVIDSKAHASEGRTVKVTGPGGASTVYTDGAGCAVATVGQSGQYTATLSDGGSGYVDYYGNSSPSVSDQVTVGQLTVHAAPLLYDFSATLNVTLVTQAGYNLPQQLPDLSLGNGEITSSNVGMARTGVINFASTGASTSIHNLWPFADGYAVWAGSCTDANPAAAPTNGAGATAVVVAPSGTANVQASLTPVTVTVVDGDGNPLPDATVWATKPAGTTDGCQTADTSLKLGDSDANGQLLTSLPDGNWTVTDGGSNSGAPFTVIGTATTTQLSIA